MLIELENITMQSAAVVIEFSRWVLLVKEGEEQKNLNNRRSLNGLLKFRFLK